MNKKGGQSLTQYQSTKTCQMGGCQSRRRRQQEYLFNLCVQTRNELYFNRSYLLERRQDLIDNHDGHQKDALLSLYDDQVHTIDEQIEEQERLAINLCKKLNPRWVAATVAKFKNDLAERNRARAIVQGSSQEKNVKPDRQFPFSANSSKKPTRTAQCLTANTSSPQAFRPPS